jgi:hypothetical protein
MEDVKVAWRRRRRLEAGGSMEALASREDATFGVATTGVGCCRRRTKRLGGGHARSDSGVCYDRWRIKRGGGHTRSFQGMKFESIRYARRVRKSLIFRAPKQL